MWTGESHPGDGAGAGSQTWRANCLLPGRSVSLKRTPSLLQGVGWDGVGWGAGLPASKDQTGARGRGCLADKRVAFPFTPLCQA